MFLDVQEAQINLNTVISAAAGISLAVNGYFLRSVARRIEAMEERQQRHADRLTWLEASSEHGRAPHRRTSPFADPQREVDDS